jgi:predicted nucleic acid-binding protein
MGTRYLIDTNVIIDAQSGVLSEKGMLFLKGVIDQDFTISFVTYIEVLGYKNVSKATEEFMALANVIETNKSIIDACIALRKQKKIKLPDAIIASTALAYGFTIISRNTKDFDDVEGLICINPYEV